MVGINSLERDGLRHAEFCPGYIMINRANGQLKTGLGGKALF